MSIKPVGKRAMAGLAAIAFTGIAALSAHAQEDAVSAAQRPVVHAPPVVAPAKPSTDTMPKWSDFPVPPSDVPTVAEFAQRVNGQTAASVKLKAQVAGLVWDKDEAEPYAAATRGRIKSAYLKSVDAYMTANQIETLGAELRRRAVPPPRAD